MLVLVLILTLGLVPATAAQSFLGVVSGYDCPFQETALNTMLGLGLG